MLIYEIILVPLRTRINLGVTVTATMSNSAGGLYVTTYLKSLFVECRH